MKIRTKEELMMDLVYGEEGNLLPEEQEMIKQSSFVHEFEQFQSFFELLGEADPLLDRLDGFAQAALPEKDLLQESGQKEIMNLRELGDFLGLSVQSILSSLNEIPHFEIQGELRFRKSSIESYLQEKETKNKSNKSNRILSMEDFLKRRVI